jgi:hypothetical protein
MGRPKKEMAKIHAKNTRKAKEQVKEMQDGKRPFNKLSARALNQLAKQPVAKKKTAK